MNEIPISKARPAHWWLPAEPEVRVDGLYWVEENGGARALLQKNLGELRGLAGGTVPMLHGDVMGDAVTLLQAHVAHTSLPGLGNTSRIEVSPWLALEGDLLLAEHELRFDQARFTLRDLAAWAGWKSWDAVYEGETPWIPRFEHLGLRRRSIGCDGGTLAITDDATWRQLVDDDAFRLTSGCQLELELDEALPIDELQYQWFSPLELLITTATGRAAPMRDLSVRNTAWVVETDEGDRAYRREWLKVRFHGTTTETSELATNQCRHRMSDFDLDSQVPAFFHSADHHRYALERYAEAGSERLPGRETGFLNAVQAVEALDTGLHEEVAEEWQREAAEIIDAALSEAGMNSGRRRAARRGVQTAHVPSLAARLRRTDLETGGVVSELAGKGWADDVETLRNAITHGRTGDVLRSTSGALVVATHISKLLFDLRWHMVLGFDGPKAQEIVERRVQQWSEAKLIADHADLLSDTGAMLRAKRHQAVTSGADNFAHNGEGPALQDAEDGAG
ncbi:ApeA N-terminal domain 1-containing protein [Monashia sp. NPDC004114]